MKRALRIFNFLLEADREGARTVLVTLTDVVGGSSRSAGSHMAVCEDGRFVGAFSGGCVEAAIVGEALRILETGRAELIRFGAGSPFIDIRLPCGGGIDILFTPMASLIAEIRQACRWLVGRHAVSLVLDRLGSLLALQQDERPTGWHGETFIARHEPDLQVVVIGHGTEVMALATLAVAHGAEVSVLSPDGAIVAAATAIGTCATRLVTPERHVPMAADPWTAIVFLFHDHDWEPALLAQALRSEAFYVGVMGSRATHHRRLGQLRTQAIPDAILDRLRGPIGLIPASRDPETLALSVLSEIVGSQRPATRT